MRLPALLLAVLVTALLVPSVALAQAEPSAEPAAEEGAVVQSVFFFSPTCPHCEYVINEHLPGIFESFGGEYTLSYDETLPVEDVSFYLMSNGPLQILLVNSSVAAGNEMFAADSERLGMDRAGVPRLDFADSYLVGSADIPEQFPTLIREGLVSGGVGWPEVPGIDAAVAPFEASGEVVAAGVEDLADAPTDDEDADDEAAILPATTGDSPLDKVARDPLGNGLSIILLIVLVISLIAVPILAVRGRLGSVTAPIVPILVVLGMVVAIYLATIETSGSAAVCGPVGDCNAVQESEYASLLGVPIGVLGTIGYLVIGGLWAAAHFGHGRTADGARVLMAVGAFGGVLFSTYLTFLEPFVIGATCVWCLSSAAIMLALLWLTAGDGWAAFQRLRGADSNGGHPAGGQHTSTPAPVGH